MIVPFFGAEWDEFGRLVLAVGLMAMLAYLAPALTSFSPAWARRFQIAAITLLAVALLLAVVAAIAWFIGKP